MASESGGGYERVFARVWGSKGVAVRDENATRTPKGETWAYDGMSHYLGDKYYTLVISAIIELIFATVNHTLNLIECF